ncbi:hypothetical protein CWC06_19780 [Pseudoalteromonas ruthenica]|nr:hypothetical protein CWC06_19780 [Pseudoalteromonas ruthenica]
MPFVSFEVELAAFNTLLDMPLATALVLFIALAKLKVACCDFKITERKVLLEPILVLRLAVNFRSSCEADLVPNVNVATLVVV